MQVVNMSASIQSQSSTRSAQSSSRDGTGGINQPSDVCGPSHRSRSNGRGLDLDLQPSHRSRSNGRGLDLDLRLSHRSRSNGRRLDLDLWPSLRSRSKAWPWL